MIAVYPPGIYSALQTAVAGPDGRFKMTVDKGTYALTATAAGYSAGYVAKYDRVSEAITLELKKSDQVIRGVVRDEGGRPIPNAVVRASAFTLPETRLFYTATDKTGRYELSLPKELYSLTVVSGDVVSSDRGYFASTDAEIDFVAYPWSRVKQPASEEVVNWIRTRAIPLKAVAAGSGLHDLRRLKPSFGEAKIIALGEATHGTREFFQLKHRSIEYLVTELDFSVFAIEASLPDAVAVNDYVLHGRGNAAAALAGMRFWIWDTKEVLDMIEWMREYNANPAHSRKLHFYGFDMQFTSPAVAGVLDYIGRRNPDRLASVTADLEFFRTENWKSGYSDLAPNARLAAVRRVEDVAALLDEHRTDSEEWRRARQYAVVILQAARWATGELGARDRAMADNVTWITRNHPEARIMLWAANAHIARRDTEGIPSMGSHLAAAYGERYVAVALTFGKGAYQGRVARLGQETNPVVELPVGPPPNHYADAALARVGVPLFGIWLRGRPRTGPVAEWFDTPHPLREFGSTRVPADYHWNNILIDQYFDAMFYIDYTTRAQPTPTGRRDR